MKVAAQRLGDAKQLPAGDVQDNDLFPVRRDPYDADVAIQKQIEPIRVVAVFKH